MGNLRKLARCLRTFVVLPLFMDLNQFAQHSQISARTWWPEPQVVTSKDLVRTVPAWNRALGKWKPKPLIQATHIQASVIPKLLQGHDVSIQSETGSGKTLAYMLPAAHCACERTFGEGGDADFKDHLFEVEDDEPSSSVCYKVLHPADGNTTKLLSRPEKYATPTGQRVRSGDEFMSRTTRQRSPLDIQFIELADGRGWYPWNRGDLRQRFGLTAVQYSKGQRVEAKEEIVYGSGDVVRSGEKGTIERLLPYVGVRWDGLPGVKAIPKPREMKVLTMKQKWASCAPDTLILTATRELCEQVAEVARQLGRRMPEQVQKNWKVAVAVGGPPGVGKNLTRQREEWPFPKGPDAPDVLVSTLEFMGYFFHRKHIPLWANIRYVVYDEVDNLVSGTRSKFLERIKVMILRAQRTEGARVQTALVGCVMPNQGGKSTRMLINRWMPHALRTAERTGWQYAPEGFDEKVRLLLDHLKKDIGTYRDRKTGKMYLKRKTSAVWPEHQGKKERPQHC
eukprot:g33603.t1